MGNLNLILFISFAAPLVMTLFVCKGKARTLLTFLFLGTLDRCFMFSLEP